MNGSISRYGRLYPASIHRDFQRATIKCPDTDREICLAQGGGAYEIEYRGQKSPLYADTFDQALLRACDFLAEIAPGKDELIAQANDPRYATTGSPAYQRYMALKDPN